VGPGQQPPLGQPQLAAAEALVLGEVNREAGQDVFPGFSMGMAGRRAGGLFLFWMGVVHGVERFSAIPPQARPRRFPPLATQQGPRRTIVIWRPQSADSLPSVPPSSHPMSDKKKAIELLRTTYLRGPNIWTYRPAMEVWLDLGELEDYPSNLLPGFNDRLLSCCRP
jgi:hypothetical protein